MSGDDAATAGAHRIGVECGGTFTDLIVFDAAGRIVATDKVFSTPHDPSEAVLTGLSEFDPALVRGATLYHGSTVATNALIERTGARVGFLTTAGFEDVPFIQRQDRAEMYNLEIVLPEPLVARECIRGVRERVSARGEIRVPARRDEVRALVRELLDDGVESFAVSLLHSYANASNEDLVASVIAELAPGVPVSQSAVVAAEFREFERACTTIADAFLKPRIAGYLRTLEAKVRDLGIAVVHVMQSNGGIVPASTAAEAPIAMLRSGPAAGVAGAIAVAGAAGTRDFVTLDMGGTSTDVAVVRRGRAETATQLRDGGLPINVSHVDIVAVGAGGGSIVSADEWGLLAVGPRSAGADPGPISYGRGGAELTVTDINVLRNFLRPDTFLGGRQELHPDRARAELSALGARLGGEPSSLVEDIFNLVNANMANAVRIATTERGIDPAAFDLMAYGGAGPLHATKVADDLGMRRVIVPPNPGLASAFGLIAAGFRREYSRTWFIESGGAAEFAEPARRLTELARGDLARSGFDLARARVDFVVDMRYRGQGFEIQVPMGAHPLTMGEMTARFNDAHEERYGHADRNRTVQAVTVRLVVRFANEATVVSRAAHSDDAVEPEPIDIIEDGVPRRATLWRRERLAVGDAVAGPAIVSEPTSTTYLPRGWELTVDEHTNLILEKRTP